MSEMLKNNSEAWGNGADDSAWGEMYQKDLPQFKPDRENGEKPAISETDVTQKMLDISSVRQDDLVDWLNRLKHGHSLSSEAEAEYEKFGGSEKEWANDLKSQLSELQEQDALIIGALEELGDSDEKNIDQIFASRAQQTQKHIETLGKNGIWEAMSDEQRDNLANRRDRYENLADWVPHVREKLRGEDEFEELTSETSESDLPEEEKSSETSEERSVANSEAEVRTIAEVLDSIRSDIEQLFAMCRGSLSLEQASGYLLISNQRMLDSTDIYAEVLKNAQDAGQVEQMARVYEAQVKNDYSSSLNAIETIRQKALTLPTSLKASMLHYCQNVENALAWVGGRVGGARYEGGEDI